MQTYDYELFDFFNSNRVINENTVKKIIKSIEKIGYVAARPIIVNKDLIIIDGQHRFEACKRLNLPIIYEELEINEHDAIIALNSAQKPWSMEDYVHSWANEGKQCYIDLLAFQEKYKIGISNSIEIFFGGGRITREIRRGDYLKTNPKAFIIMQFILEAKEVIHFWHDIDFTRALITAFNSTSNENMNILLKKISILKRQGGVREYLISFENIINKEMFQSLL